MLTTHRDALQLRRDSLPFVQVTANAAAAHAAAAHQNPLCRN